MARIINFENVWKVFGADNFMLLAADERRFRSEFYGNVKKVYVPKKFRGYYMGHGKEKNEVVSCPTDCHFVRSRFGKFYTHICQEFLSDISKEDRLKLLKRFAEEESFLPESATLYLDDEDAAHLLIPTTEKIYQSDLAALAESFSLLFFRFRRGDI